MNSDPTAAYLGQQEHISEVQSLGLHLDLEEVINNVTEEELALLLGDCICAAVHKGKSCGRAAHLG